MKKNGLNIKITELNGKSKNSRKGTYVYIKEGKKTSYYKYDLGEGMDYILAYHNDKKKKKAIGNIKQYKEEFEKAIYSKQRRKSTPLRRKAQKYKRTKLEGVMTKGIGTTDINELRNISNSDLQKAKERMLKDIVLDKEIRKLVAKEENMKKLKNRIEIQLHVKNRDGELLDFVKVFGKTPEEVKAILEKSFKNGDLVAEDYKGNYKGICSYYNFQGNVQKEGTIRRISAKFIFRKG